MTVDPNYTPVVTADLLDAEISPIIDEASDDVTAANLSELTGGGETALHSHAGGGGSDSGIQYVDVQLIDAQIKALPSTPVAVVAAPGSGLRILPLAMYFRGDWAGSPYTNVEENAYAYLSGGRLYDNSYPVANLGASGPVVEGYWAIRSALTADRGILADSGTHAAGGDTVTISSFGGTPTAADNQALQLAIYNTPDDNEDSGNLTGGNAGNTLSIRVWYAVVPSVAFGA